MRGSHQKPPDSRIARRGRRPPKKEEYSMKNLFTTMFGRNDGRIHNPVGTAATALSAAGAMRHLLVNLAGEMSE